MGWVYGKDETFNSDEYNSKEEAIEAGRKEFAGKWFEVGETRERVTSDLVKADKIIDLLIEIAEEEPYPYNQNWLSSTTITPEAKQELQELLEAWVDKYDKPNWFVVVNVECIK